LENRQNNSHSVSPFLSLPGSSETHDITENESTALLLSKTELLSLLWKFLLYSFF